MAECVLVVDDSLTVRMDLQEILEAENFVVKGAATLGEAREHVAAELPQVILLDLELGEADDGLEFLKELRRRARTAELPVILLSAREAVEDRLRGVELGATDYLGKPYRRGPLLTAVNKAIAGATRGVPSPQQATDKRPPLALIVDDSATYREELKAALLAAGFVVREARDGPEGIRSAETVIPDVAIVDNQMPGMDGAEMIQYCRLSARLRNLPCLLLTASTDQADELRALGAGADAFENKASGLGVVIKRVEILARQNAAALEEPARALRVLAVDDSETYLQEITETLREDGFDVVQARSGEQGLAALETLDIDCVVLDMMMPKMTGIEVCRRVRAGETTRRIPILVLTGHESQEHMLEAFDAGADDFVSKQSGFAVIRARLQTLIRRGELEAANLRIVEKLHEKDVENARERAMIAAKSGFIAGVSHEIRTPLNGVLGMLDLLLDTELTKTQIDMVQTATRSGRLLLAIINDILDLSKIDAGRLEVVQQSFDLFDVLRDMLFAFSSRASEKNLDFCVDLPAQMPRFLLGDAGRISQVITNLLSNAIKFTERGYVRLSADADLLPERLALSVEDTGMGIAEDRLDAVFEEFRQADASIAGTYGGTGLGLTISKRLSELMGGELGVRSELGVGTVFQMTLPLRQNVAEQDAAQDSPAVVLDGVRVLVIDDSPLTSAVVAKTVEDAGARCVRCGALSDGRALCAEQKFDVIVVRGPQEDAGGKLTRAAVVKALGVSGPGSDAPGVLRLGGESDAARKACFDGWMACPLWPPTLLRVLERLRGARPGGGFILDEPNAPELERRRQVLLPASVLVVDDNPVNLQVAAMMLERLGCRTECVFSGAEALERIAAGAFDIVLLDCQMPGMSGFEVAMELRRRPEHASLPVIALTADSTQGARQSSVDAGMSDYMTKPIDPRELEKMLRKWTRDAAPPLRPSQRVSREAVPSSSSSVAEASETTESEAAPQSVDWAMLESIQQLAAKRGEGVFQKMFTDFIDRAQAHLREMKECCASGTPEDRQRAAQIAHAMRGTAGSFGASGLAQLTHQLEERVASGESLERIAEEMQQVFDQYLEVVRPKFLP